MPTQDDNACKSVTQESHKILHIIVADSNAPNHKIRASMIFSSDQPVCDLKRYICNDVLGICDSQHVKLMHDNDEIKRLDSLPNEAIVRVTGPLVKECTCYHITMIVFIVIVAMVIWLSIASCIKGCGRDYEAVDTLFATVVNAMHTFRQRG